MSKYKNKKLFLKAIKKCVPFSACTDCYLGVIDTSKNKWLTAPKNYTDYNERLSIHRGLKLEKLPTIVLLLESPHKDEFKEKPYIPAKGDTGKNILQYFAAKCPAFPHTKYRVLLVNAIQYQCSLGVPTKNNRTDIFIDMWHKKSIREDLSKRLIKYEPEIIINACTKGGDANLRVMVQKQVNKTKYKASLSLYHSSHPCLWNNQTRILSGGWKK